uniref:Methyltransferase like 25B n=1 Tax=Salvator merianae TaxID=96440 RepID=A0A8D0DMZ2_SALMN
MSGFSLETQKRLAADLSRFLSLYSFIIDAYIIEFFTDNLWVSLPSSWQAVLADLSSPQLATLFLESQGSADIRYWKDPLTKLLKGRTQLPKGLLTCPGLAWCLNIFLFTYCLTHVPSAFPQASDGFSLQGPRHVRGWVDPRAPWTEFLHLPFLEGGQVLLTGLHACGDLSVALLRHFVRCPYVVGITSVACCYMKLTTEEEYGYPLSMWVSSLPGHQLSYKAREGACHALEDFVQRLKHESATLRTHCFRAMLETVIRSADPSKKRLGVQTINRAHLLTFEEYARLGLERVGLDPSVALDAAALDAMLAQQQRVVAFFSLALLLAPLVETLLLLDRMIFLQEQGFQCELLPLFDPTFSPRNLVLVAAKTKLETCPPEHGQARLGRLIQLNPAHTQPL